MALAKLASGILTIVLLSVQVLDTFSIVVKAPSLKPTAFASLPALVQFVAPIVIIWFAPGFMLPLLGSTVSQLGLLLILKLMLAVPVFDSLTVFVAIA